MIPGMPGGLSASGGAAGPSSAKSESSFDSSWNITFGGGDIAANRNDPLAGAASGFTQGYLPYVLIAAGVLIAWRMTRRR